MVAISRCHEFYEQLAGNHINDSTGSAQISVAMLFFLSSPLFLLKGQPEAPECYQVGGPRSPGSVFQDRQPSASLPWILYRVCWVGPALFQSLE